MNEFYPVIIPLVTPEFDDSTVVEFKLSEVKLYPDYMQHKGKYTWSERPYDEPHAEFKEVRYDYIYSYKRSAVTTVEMNYNHARDKYRVMIGVIGAKDFSFFWFDFKQEALMFQRILEQWMVSDLEKYDQFATYIAHLHKYANETK